MERGTQKQFPIYLGNILLCSYYWLLFINYCHTCAWILPQFQTPLSLWKSQTCKYNIYKWPTTFHTTECSDLSLLFYPWHPQGRKTRNMGVPDERQCPFIPPGNPRHKTFCRSVSPTTSENTVLTRHSRYEIGLGSSNPSVAKLTDNYIWRRAVQLLGMGSRGTPHLHDGGVGGKNPTNTPCVLSTTGFREWLMS